MNFHWPRSLGASCEKPTSSTSSSLLLITTCLLAILSLVSFGIIGVGRGDTSAFADVRYYYTAGGMFASGLNPYDIQGFREYAGKLGLDANLSGYVYPPHSLILWLPLSWLPFDAARFVVTGTNFFLILSIAVLMARAYLLRVPLDGSNWQTAGAVFVAAIIVGNPFATHLIWTGQNGILILACLLIALHEIKEGRFTVAGVCLALASVKPQLSVLVITWVLFAGHFRAIGVMILTIVALSLIPIATLGPTILMDWMRSLSAYQLEAASALPYMTTLKSFLLGVFPAVPSKLLLALPLVGVASAIALARLPALRDLTPTEVLALLLLGSLLFIQGRDYEIAVLAPVVPVLWSRCRGINYAPAAALLILVLLCIPQRFAQQWDVFGFHVARAGLLAVLWLSLWILILRSGAHPALHRENRGPPLSS